MGLGVFLIGPVYIVLGIFLRMGFEEQDLLIKLELLLLAIGMFIGLMFL